MTLTEVIDKYGENEVFAPIPNDPILKEEIKAWFGYRRVCTINPEKFLVFFHRTLRNDHERYSQLLRIEPGVAEYDWLVQQYHERQTTLDRLTAEGITTEYGKTDTMAYGKTLTKTGGQSTQRTFANTDTNSESGETIDTLAKTGDVTDGYGKVTSLAHGHVATTAYTGTDTTQHDNTEKAHSGGTASGLTKTNPSSIAYASGSSYPVKDESLDGDTQGLHGDVIEGLDFHYADGQTLSSNRASAINTNNGQDIQNYNSTDTLTHSGTDQTSNSGEDVKTFDTTDTRTVDHGKVNTVVHAGTVTDTKSGADTDRASGSDVRTLGGSDYTEKGSTAFDLTREITKGRQKEVAEILAKAATYISQTCAWDWLADKLEPCFYGIYDEEV